MAEELAQNGVIRYSWQFLMARVLHPGSEAASRRISVRSRRHAVQHPESHRARRRLLLRTGGARRQQHVRHRGQRGPLRFPESRPISCAPPAILRSSTIWRPKRPRSKAICSPPPIASRAPPPYSSFARMMTSQFRKQWRELQACRHSAAGERNRDSGIAGGKRNRASRGPADRRVRV